MCRTGAAMGFGLTFIVITFFGFVGFLGESPEIRPPRVKPI